MVPILITWDVDPDRWTKPARREQSLALALDLCEELGARSTFFITANFAHEYAPQIARMQALGQEIGCHGLTHTDEEDYNRMTPAMQRAYLGEARDKLTAATGTPPVSFRSPRVKTSATTLALLGECGYRADSSVCSQRIDFVSSNLINWGWISAPRRPYHPHPANAFKRGDLPIWEVPVSALVVPFISGALRVFGLRFMQGFFKTLYGEARRTGKPIVYLAHPTEYILAENQRARLTLASFHPQQIRTHGFLIRNLLFRLGGPALFSATRALVAYMKSFPDVTFMTVGDYATQLNQSH